VVLTTAHLPEDPGSGFAAAFPGTAGGTEPMALLSFASAGDMKFGDPRSAGNRERFLRAVGMDPARVHGLELAHSRNVLFPSRGEAASELARDSGGADGIVLDDEEFAASVTVADCMPIWILDRGSGAFGLLHSGWRGTGILAVAIRAMAARLGSEPSSMAVILGPAIGPCCYEVAGERAARFSAEFGADGVRRRGASAYLDLRSANLSIAERLGVGQLLSVESCTSCDGRLGSYRRQGGAAFTRMLAVCGRSPCATGILPSGERT
jgi:hypothetical protein